MLVERTVLAVCLCVALGKFTGSLSVLHWGNFSGSLSLYCIGETFLAVCHCVAMEEFCWQFALVLYRGKFAGF